MLLYSAHSACITAVRTLGSYIVHTIDPHSWTTLYLGEGFGGSPIGFIVESSEDRRKAHIS